MPDPLVPLAEVKARLGIRSNHRDAELERLLAAAQGQVEDYSGRLLTRRLYTQHCRRFEPGEPIDIWVYPVHEIEALTYQDPSGAAVPLADARLFAPEGGLARVFPAVGAAWPAVGTPADIQLKVDAGYEDDVPPQLVQAVLLLVGHWFENHEAVVVGTSAVELPMGVRDICEQFRFPGLV